MPVRYIVAPDKFKGSLTAVEAARAIALGIRSADPSADIRLSPVADGGEGTVDAFLAGGDWTAHELRARGVLGDLVTARFAVRDAIAVCEMASASGFASIAANETRGALFGSSYGTGQTILAALDADATRIVLGIGGTATNDAGAGALTALGARFLDARGNAVRPGGAALADVVHLDVAGLDARLQTCTLELATDVDNPLLGPRGATAVFARQKGAKFAELERLEASLAHLAVVVRASGGRDGSAEPGSGAGGGLPFLFRAFTRARIVNGFEVVAAATDLARHVASANYCFTGEGSIDAQTLGGKAVAGIARLAYGSGVPTFAFGGRVARADVGDALAALGCEAIAISNEHVSIEQSMRDAARYLEDAARSVTRALNALGNDGRGRSDRR